MCSDGSCMPTHDHETGCHNHCNVECSEEEQLCVGEVRDCAEPDFCIHKEGIKYIISKKLILSFQEFRGF